MLLFVFDRLVVRDGVLEKTWQMHTMGKYELSGRRAITCHPDGERVYEVSEAAKSLVLTASGSVRLERID